MATTFPGVMEPQMLLSNNNSATSTIANHLSIPNKGPTHNNKRDRAPSLLDLAGAIVEQDLLSTTSSNINGSGVKRTKIADLDDAAKALVHLHTSPLVTMTVDQRILFPPLDLNSNDEVNASDVAAHNLCKLMMSTNSNGRPRSHSLSALEYRSSSTNSTASNHPPSTILPISTASTTTTIPTTKRVLPNPAARVYPDKYNNHTKRPRSQSMSVSQHQSSTNGTTTNTTSNHHHTTRSFSSSNRHSTQTTTSRRNRSQSMGSYADNSVGGLDQDMDMDDSNSNGSDSNHHHRPASYAGSGAAFDPNLVGAYSPETRKLRIARFLEKRQNRIWRKSIKYNVRKNFADSRLRVKGRFVRKEDELVLRDFMSLT
jgi:hypothetical protein